MTIRRIQISDARLVCSDVHLDVDDAVEVGELEEQLEAAGYAAKPLTVGGYRFDESATVADLGIEHGSIVGCGHHDPGVVLSGCGTHLVVVAGPDAGAVVQLQVGVPLTIGRGSISSLTINDPLLSGRHIQIDLLDSLHATVTDLGSTNGSAIEGAALDEPTDVHAGEYIHIGSTVVTLEHTSAEDLAVLGPPIDGERSFPKQFRSAHPELPKKIDAPKPPSEDDGSGGQSWWRALLPLVTGVGFAFITGRFIFLLIVIISPIVMAVESIRRKRKSKGDAAKRKVEYDAALVQFRSDVVLTRRAERRRRRDDALCGGSSALLGQSRHRRLWERSASDVDFAHVAVGLAALPSAIAASDPDGRFDGDQWGTPLQHDLLETGSLAIVGSMDRARSVARNILVNLAATHSPADVRVWLLTDDERGTEWGSARWLPHVAGHEHVATIAVGPADRQRAVRTLRAILEQRGEQRDRRTAALPLHVIVVDGSSMIGAADLADLVGAGAETGIAAISLDPQLVPEGAGATLRLGENADEASFVSRAQPFLDNVIVTELTAVTADRAIRPMAPLRPTVSTDTAGLGGTVHLVDLEPIVSLQPDKLLERWNAIGPISNAVIGATVDGPMMVDIVNDGPHGLIGGTSGSGKTEFLKTLFISLCAQNHPDDLSIVVVDFKGGVDHEAIRPLPHVIDVATNLDIDQFKRTIELLTAEQLRRQDLLSSVGASNVTAYRSARERDRSLPPMPRLLVVVDEFGELLSNPDGKDQLKKLESITRIGRALGLHLLLVTQNFESSLPPQIDANAGLRISLRVQKPAHSKIVLDSDAAAMIPDHRIGRGFGRFHGRDLIEFQTARVAGRRRDLATLTSDISLRPMPFSLLGAPTRQAAIDDVPADETDMHAIIERVKQAVELSGWLKPSVPWPSPLPQHVSVSALHQRRSPGTVAIGLEDHPELQARGLTTLSAADDQVAVIGGPDADIPGVLTTIAVASALAMSADDLHIYALDLLGRGVGSLDALPHTGAVVLRNDQLALRLIRWLSGVASERRAMLAASGASSMSEHRTLGYEAPPQIMLLINGADRLLGTESAHSQLVSPLLRLLGDAIGVDIQIVIGGGVRLASHKIGLNITRRIVLEMNERSDYSAVGVDRSFATDLGTDRRAVDAASGRLTQLGRLASPDQIEGESVRRLANELAPAASRLPRRFVDITWPLPYAAMPLDAVRPPDVYEAPLPIGVGSETGEWVWLDMFEDGPLLGVTGSSKSGRSTTLAFLGRMASERGRQVVSVALSRRSPLAELDAPWLIKCSLDNIERVAADLGDDPVILIDDLNRLDDAAVLKPLLSCGDPFVIASAPADTLSSRMGVMREMPSLGAGLILAPQGGLDGNAFGLRRLSDELLTDPRPGKGILAVAGEAIQIQIPLLD